MPTKVSSIKKGDKFWCFHRQLTKPLLGTVICLTPQSGKLIGLQFDEPLPSGLSHLDCDGRGKKGYCMWGHPDFLLTEVEYTQQGQNSNNEIDELSLN